MLHPCTPVLGAKLANFILNTWQTIQYIKTNKNQPDYIKPTSIQLAV